MRIRRSTRTSSRTCPTPETSAFAAAAIVANETLEAASTCGASSRKLRSEGSDRWRVRARKCSSVGVELVGVAARVSLSCLVGLVGTDKCGRKGVP